MLALRARQQRNLLATLLLSQGVPMLLGGDELGRTQGGNNNAYCQDNELSWFDWDDVDEDLLAFTRGLVAFRRATRCSAAATGWSGGPARRGLYDTAWLTADGREMTEADWHTPGPHACRSSSAGQQAAAGDRGEPCGTTPSCCC